MSIYWGYSINVQRDIMNTYVYKMSVLYAGHSGCCYKCNKKRFLEIASEQSNFDIINNTLYILSNNAIVLYSKHSSLVDY